MSTKTDDIAIVGMSCIFPGARNLDQYWENIINKRSCISDIPHHRVDPTFISDGDHSGHFHWSKGGFIDNEAYVDEESLEGIDVQSTEPDQMISLHLAKKALEDASAEMNILPNQKCGVIIGRISYGGLEIFRRHESVMGIESMRRLLNAVRSDLSNEQIEAILSHYYNPYHSNNPLGAVPSMIASRIASQLAMTGPAYMVDAASSSALVAIDSCIKELTFGKSELMVAGGIHTGQIPSIWSVSKEFGNYSKTGTIKPFDANSDGLLPGEGAGFVVLERLENALKNKRRIYATIKGMSLSSAHSSIESYTKVQESQVQVIREAWQSAEVEVKHISYIESHCSATPTTDASELKSLSEALSAKTFERPIEIGTTKPMIGHSMAASGMASVIKVAKAIYHRIIPPTINCEDPIEELQQENFTVPSTVEEWKNSPTEYVAGINSLGVGGINAHMVLQGIDSNHESEEELIAYARPSAEELVKAIELNEPSGGKGNFRLVLFNPNQKRRKLASRIVMKGNDWKGRQDVWFTKSPLLKKGHKIAFIFPGLDPNGLANIKVSDFPSLAARHNLKTDSDFDYSRDRTTSETYSDLHEASRLLDGALRSMNVTPDIVAGHSVGEWTAATTVGLVDPKVANFLNQRILSKGFDDMTALFLAVSASWKDYQEEIEKWDDVYLANDNCTNQFVLCGKKSKIEELQNELSKRQVLSNVLPFQTGFHSPFGEVYVEECQTFLDQDVDYGSPTSEIWSSITARPFPAASEDIRQVQIDFLTQPVRFRQLVEAMYDNGVRFFVQMGSGSVAAFISDTLQNQQFTTVSASSSKRIASKQIKRVLAAMYIDGRSDTLEFLQPIKTKPQTKVDLSFPLMDWDNAIRLENIPKSFETKERFSVGDNLIQQMVANMDGIQSAQKEVLAALDRRAQSTDGLAVIQANRQKDDFVEELEFSLNNHPYLLDHVAFRRRCDRIGLDDGIAVVPLTMFMDMFIEIATNRFSDCSVVKISGVSALQFLWVEDSINVRIEGKWIDHNSLRMSIDGVVAATLTMGSSYDDSLVGKIVVKKNENAPIKAEQAYGDGYLFHGKEYQGIVSIDAYTDDTFRTTLIEKGGKGSMMDSVGQSVGLHHHFALDNIRGFPVGIGEILFHSDPLDKTGVFSCSTKVTHSDDDFIYNDIFLEREGKPWCSIKDWQFRRSAIDHKVWKILNHADDYEIASPFQDGLYMIKSSLYDKTNTWFTIQNVYLNNPEKSIYNEFSLSRRKEWLLGRICAKDAISNEFKEKTGQNIHPAEFSIINNEDGQPKVYHRKEKNIYVSIAHKKSIAIAMASMDEPVGVDIEEIKEREESFIDLVLNEKEKKLLPLSENLHEWVTRAWVAKESYGKSIGVGLSGSPKNFEIHSIDDYIIVINGVRILTKKIENYIIGYTTKSNYNE